MINQEDTTASGSTADAAVGKTAEALKGGIDSANDAVDAAMARAANTIEGVRSTVTPALKGGIDRAETLVRQGSTYVSDTTLFARVRASELADQVVDYTRQNPVNALLIAAAGGAVVLSLIGTLTRRRR